MPTKAKKLFVVEQHPEGFGQSLFFRLWKLMSTDEPLARQDPDLYSGLESTRRQVEQYAEQMRRQKVHVDEIKRLCHVPTD